MDKVKAGRLAMKIVLWTIGFGFLVFLLFVSLFIFGPRIESYFEQTEFDSKQWQLYLANDDNIKQRMVKDLLDKHQLLGMTEKDIQALLGVPPKTNYFKDYDYVYWLGPEQSRFALDSEWLAIKFENGKVVKADILTD